MNDPILDRALGDVANCVRAVPPKDRSHYIDVFAMVAFKMMVGSCGSRAKAEVWLEAAENSLDDPESVQLTLGSEH